MIRLRRVFQVIAMTVLLAALCAPAGTGIASPGDQTSTIPHSVQQIVKTLTPEEKVGQLFLVTFHGRQVDSKTQINDLISNYHIGGVALRAGNDNFTAADTAAADAYQLVSQLQSIAWDAATSGGQGTPVDYLPIFVGISQEGDGYPNDQIVNGLTQLPNLMAIGATWNTDLAKQVGAVMGQELSAIGFNLYLGPGLDVLDQPYTSDSGQNLGTRVFGGDPYWVSKMGQAYISGVHQGSNDRIAVIAKNFPGLGSSDRLPEDEVATIRKSLDQLKQVDLPPFFAVTGAAPSADMAADGLLVSQIRYQGLQENIRSMTRPVSLDPQALSLLMNLPDLARWKSAGGVMVSDDLGSPAIRGVYDPSMKDFKASQVALDAFLAGNDLLYLDNFQATGDPDSFTTIIHTLSVFAQRYRLDPAFAQRVDDSVGRILALKMRLYPSMDLNHVVPPEAGLSAIGSQASQQVTYDVASQAATLISPTRAELDAALPQPPDRSDRFVFLTDTQTFKECSQCPDQDSLGTNDLQNAVMRLYGPSTSGQVASARVSSYSYNDILQYLNGQSTPANQNLEDDLRTADWIVVAARSVNPSRPSSLAFRRLLNERPDLILKNQHIIYFDFAAPFDLDATDISKLTAYYGLYSKSPPFLDTAAKILFHELTPKGNSPVTVLGAGYDLNVVTTPDPTQVIPLILDIPGSVEPSVTSSPAPTATPVPPLYKVGDTIPLRTGVIYDHNHNIVPDGTVVRFIFTRNADTSTTQQIEAETTEGVARASYRIDTAGLLEIRVTSDPAQISQSLRIDISKTEEAGVTVIAPTPVPSDTPTPTLTPTATVTATPVPLPPAPVRPEFSDWLLAMLTIAFSTGLVYFAGTWWVNLRWAIRWGLCAVLGGLAAYLYLAAKLPGSVGWVHNSGTTGVVGMTVLGVVLGWIGGLVWRAWVEKRAIERIHR